MVTESETTDYLQEIRNQVCRRCVERPPGGPPCQPLGKFCGVELHLPKLIDSIHQVHSNRITPYLDHNRNEICSQCCFLQSSICPCPMDYLAVLIVEAVESVDKRREQEPEKNMAAESNPTAVPDLEAVRRAYKRGTGSWTGCDWPTRFGESRLNLDGMDSGSLAVTLAGARFTEEWRRAQAWLAEVERRAREAERKADLALKAVAADRWEEALQHAQGAWALEFSTGRPLYRDTPFAWLELRETIETLLAARNAKNINRGSQS